MHRRTYKQKSIKSDDVFDKLIYGIALISPIMTIPQALEIWINKETQGISISTWFAYCSVSLFWVFYGLRRREKPLVLSNSLFFVLAAIIVIGIFFNR